MVDVVANLVCRMVTYLNVMVYPPAPSPSSYSVFMILNPFFCRFLITASCSCVQISFIFLS